MRYYSGIAESIKVNILYYIMRIINRVKLEYGNFDRFYEMEEKISLGALSVFCGKHSRILIYGAGYYAKSIRSL